jgi:hypothetical protein
MRIRTTSRITGTMAFCLVAACALLSGCSSGSGATDEAKTGAGQQQVAVGLTSAEQVAATLAQSVSTMTTTVVYTAATDPDHLLGKAHGYLSKVAFSDSRIQPADVEGARPDSVARGGSVETFATAAQAHTRAKELTAGADGAATAGEYHYYVSGSLIRVSQILTPLQAEDYQEAAQSLN